MSAIELKEGRRLPNDVAKPTPEMLKQMPVTAFSPAWRNLDAKASADLNQRVGFDFTDTHEQYTLWVRRGVCELQPGIAMTSTCASRCRRRSSRRRWARPAQSGDQHRQGFEVVKGNKLSFIGFMKLFTPPETQ